MFLNTNFVNLKKTYIIFFLTVLFIISTVSKVQSSIFKVSEIKVTEPFNPNFQKKKVIDKAILLAFKKLLSMTISTNDMHKISKFNVNEIKKGLNEYHGLDNKKYKIYIPFQQLDGRFFRDVNNYNKKFVQMKSKNHLKYIYNNDIKKKYDYQWTNNKIFN